MENKFNLILTILENPTRREIIKRLSKKPSYPLQLSKDLGLGQQLVAKHLKVMESAGVVKSSMESSPHGPDRKIYVLSKSVSLTLDVAPNLFRTKVVTFDTEHTNRKEDISEKFTPSSAHEEPGQISPFKSMIFDIDKKLEILENERTILLYIRNYVMDDASLTTDRFEESKMRKIRYHTLEEQRVSIRNISESLNLREAVVHRVLLKLKKDFNFGDEHVEEKTETKH